MRIFVGMDREPWEEFQRKHFGGYVGCSCGSILQTCEQVREHWQSGHFDEPRYREEPDETPKA